MIAMAAIVAQNGATGQPLGLAFFLLGFWVFLVFSRVFLGSFRRFSWFCEFLFFFPLYLAFFGPLLNAFELFNDTLLVVSLGFSAVNFCLAGEVL